MFTYKLDTDGYLVKFKARLVIHRDLQPVIRKDTYTVTLATRVFKALMAIAAKFNLDIHQLDAVNTFTNVDLDEEVYIRFSPSFEEEGMVIHILKALYGLRRSPFLWANELSGFVESQGL